MGQFANTLRRQAARALLSEFHQEATPGNDPVLELIGILLGDEDASESPPAGSSLTTEQWMTWNQLAMDREAELVRAVTRVVDREATELPQERQAMRAWAAWLVLSTLDEMGMA